MTSDPLWTSVMLLLNGQGSNGGTTFTDLSSKAKTLTTLGNTQFSNAVVLNGTTSMKFDGVGDAIEVNNTNDADFTFTGDFTLEAFAYLTATAGDDRWIFGCQTPASVASSATEINQDYRSYANSAASYDIHGGAVANTTWQHHALNRVGSAVDLFIAGTRVATGTFSGTVDYKNTFTVGAYPGGGVSTSWNGYIQAARVTKGTARYASGASITPPTLPFLLGPTASLFRPPQLNGLGSGGPFFQNPLG